MGSMRNVKKVVMASALLLVLTLSMGGGVASKSQDTSATYENLRLFTEVLSIVQSQYVDEVPAKDVIYNAIKGTLRGLDPHSSFLDPDMYREMQVETSGSFGGLGIEITLRDDILTVVTPIESVVRESVSDRDASADARSAPASSSFAGAEAHPPDDTAATKQTSWPSRRKRLHRNALIYPIASARRILSVPD